jgi:hypothetical protein
MSPLGANQKGELDLQFLQSDLVALQTASFRLNKLQVE